MPSAPAWRQNSRAACWVVVSDAATVAVAIAVAMASSSLSLCIIETGINSIFEQLAVVGFTVGGVIKPILVRCLHRSQIVHLFCNCDQPFCINFHCAS